MQSRYFSDEELVAYLDGENEFAPVAEIAAALKTDVALAKRLAALRVDTDEIAKSFDGLASPDRRMPALPAAPQAQLRYGAIIAAAVVALVVGFGAGWSTSGIHKPDWRDYVAAYQALYINGTLAHVDQSDAAKQSELSRVSAAIGKSIKLGVLNVSPELEYKRSQILGFRGKALVQLAFLTSTGQPLALCIIRSDGKSTQTATSAEMEGMSSTSWSHGNYEYLLIGGTDQSMISRLADKFISLKL